MQEAPDLGWGQGGLLGSDIQPETYMTGRDRGMTQNGRETATISVSEISLVTVQFLLVRHPPTGESREM